MRTRTLLLATVIAASTATVAVETATAKDMPDMDQQPRGHMMMQGGMGHDMMCPMMQGGMMGSQMGSGMMRSAMGGLFGSRVTPVMNLSLEDVRSYLAAQLERLDNKRLKVGDVNSGDGTITAAIVTVDNSLVQRLKVDRHTGAITYEH